MKAYSADLREKIALADEHHDYTLDEVAELFDVGRRTAARFVQKHRAGLSLAPRPHDESRLTCGAIHQSQSTMRRRIPAADG